MNRDVCGLMKPKSAADTVKRAGQYLEVMRASGRPVDRITISAKDYDQIVKAMNARRMPHEDPVTALNYRDIPVVRA